MSLETLFDQFDGKNLSADISAFIIKTCLHMRKGEDFQTSMNNVAKDLREYTDAYAACILTISRDLYKFNVVGENVRNNEIVLQNVFDKIPYEIVETWEELTLENDSIIITNSADMENIRSHIRFNRIFNIFFSFRIYDIADTVYCNSCLTHLGNNPSEGSYGPCKHCIIGNKSNILADSDIVSYTEYSAENRDHHHLKSRDQIVRYIRK